ncbi:IS6 family transposase [Paraburkholderia sp. RP-4-7]|uniref:IS6 family transposase n=1 Tax=Paraburkholderia polaris TaxID=2728848 RepID=A0A848ISZ0_9BURK|nr:IS6 family transposase [Paraburkholderia polaris]
MLDRAVAPAPKRLHDPLDVMLKCARLYVAYPLNLWHLEEMMVEHGVPIDHLTVHRWAIKLMPVLEKSVCGRKRPVVRRWRMDETYSRVCRTHLRHCPHANLRLSTTCYSKGAANTSPARMDYPPLPARHPPNRELMH